MMIINYVVLRQCMYSKFNWIQLMTHENFNERAVAGRHFWRSEIHIIFTLEQMEKLVSVVVAFIFFIITPIPGKEKSTLTNSHTYSFKWGETFNHQL